MADAEASIAVAAKHSPLAVFLYLTKFVVEVDGNASEGSWGRARCPCRAGPTHGADVVPISRTPGRVS